ncbi:MAG TPA: hypothetical protein VJO33_02795 [Gemmatimonadaceae bacterium]|nr:hypothetical protein [Gemmatimonadaceae bacterium]
MLGVDPIFISRCAPIMCDVASTVLVETGIGPTHQQRADYARKVIASPSLAAIQAAPFLAQTTNVASTISFEDTGITTTVTDPALLSQINASWNDLSGIDTGN